jgi:hypothetical protein
MKVICVNDKGTTKLIKGQVYEANSLFKTWQGSLLISIEGAQSYDIKRFTTIDGNSLSTVNLFNNRNYNNYLDYHKNYVGEYVKCKYDGRSKQLIPGQIYLVMDSGEKGFKIKGLKGYFSKFRFQELSISEKRNLKLNNLAGNKIKINKDRKFLQYSDLEQKKIFFEVLNISLKNLESIEKIDYDILYKMILKVGNNYGIIKKDIDNIFNKSLGEIFDNILR